MARIKGLDLRYSLTREHTGQPTAMYVVRFVGEWVGSATKRDDAFLLAHAHDIGRAARVSGHNADTVINQAAYLGRAKPHEQLAMLVALALRTSGHIA